MSVEYGEVPRASVRAEARAELAKGMLSKGINISLIVELTGLTETEIRSL